MVGLGGLEPPTSRLSGVRSNQLSYRPTPRDDAEEIEPARRRVSPSQPSLTPDPMGSEPARAWAGHDEPGRVTSQARFQRQAPEERRE
jgi:hypothetical protein